MTQPQNNDPNYDPLIAAAKKPAVSFKHSTQGERKVLQVQSLSRETQQMNYDSGKPDFWDSDIPGQRGNPKMAIVFDVFDESAGELRTLWAPRPGSMLNALVAAQTRSGQRISPGGVLEVWIDDYKTSTDKKKEYQKLYAAEYTPPETPDALAEPVATARPATEGNDRWAVTVPPGDEPPF